MKIFSKILLILIFMSFPIKQYAQSVKNLHSSEVWWIMTHPFIAKKSWDISKQASSIATAHISDPLMDGDYNGGMVDAFRHTLWMAMLVQEIRPEAALKLGKAHEKGNYKDFKQKILEEGKLPDSMSCEMDLRNNEVGIDLGLRNMGTDTDTLILFVRSAVRRGECWKIKKDSLGYFLNSDGEIIPESEWKGKWITPKVLVPSNYKSNF